MCLRGLQTRALVRGISEYIRSLVLGTGLMFCLQMLIQSQFTCNGIYVQCQIQHWKNYFSCFSVGHMTEGC